MQPALLPNGSVLLNMRDVGTGAGHRLLARSDDNGNNFCPSRAVEALIDSPSTAGSMLYLDSCLFTSNLGETAVDRAHNDPCLPPPAVSPCTTRHNLTLRSSCDDGQSWKFLSSIWEGPAGSSSLAPLPWRSDAIGVLFESGSWPLQNSTPYEFISYVEIAVHVHMRPKLMITATAAPPLSPQSPPSLTPLLHPNVTLATYQT